MCLLFMRRSLILRATVSFAACANACSTTAETERRITIKRGETIDERFHCHGAAG